MNLKTNPELLPLIEWWEKDGKQLVLMLAVGLAAFGGWKYWQYHTASVKAAASDALVTSLTTEELEDAVSKYAGKAAGGALKLRLAKSYFDGGRYEEALSQYEALHSNPPKGFEEIPAVGRAQCLEALGKFEEAQKAFDAFGEGNPKGYLTLTAQLGAARCLCQKGDSKAALARIDALKAANKGESMAIARIEAVESSIKRFGKKASPSDDAAKPVAEAAKPAETVAKLAEAAAKTEKAAESAAPASAK